MDSENSKTNEPHRFRLPLVNQLNLNKNMASTNLSIYNIRKNIKSAYSNNKFKISVQLGMINLICLMDLVLLWTFKTTMNLSSKNTKNFS